MKRYFLLFLSIFSFSMIHAQNGSLWKRIAHHPNFSAGETPNVRSQGNNILYQLDESALKRSLSVLYTGDRVQTVEIEIPNIKGEFEKFTIQEFSNFEPELQVQFPEIRSFKGIGLTDKSASIYCSISPRGIQTMVFRPDHATEFIEKVAITDSVYELFDSKNSSQNSIPLVCSTTNDLVPTLQQSASVNSTTGVYRTLRLALACTAEYTAYFGGVSQALAAMNATLTRVNGVFNRDLALHLNLIANTTMLIYSNPVTDPFSPASQGVNGAWNLELQRDLTTKIGNANYDIGHLFGASGGGGNAGCIGCVCQNPTAINSLGKGSGFSSPSNGKPEGDIFDIDFVAHEIGHQLGANHTFSHETEGTGVNVEPGGGSTIMAYAGLTDYNIQRYSDDYFAYVSIAQIQANLATKTCPVTTILSNRTPIVNAGLDYTIPKGTAFILKGTGSDPNGDILSFCWEQNDSAVGATGANSIAYATKSDGPLFRSFPPSASLVRFMPSLDKVLNRNLNTKWESVAEIARSLHFTLTVRDNAANGLAQTNTDAMEVIVDATKGPLVITSQNTANLSWKPLSIQAITWQVNNTSNLPGSATVTIRLSVDGGQTFPTVLKANTPNDGSELIIVPAGLIGQNCRILIEPTANIFFAVNSEPFAIGYTVESSCTTSNFTTPLVIPESSTYAVRTIQIPESDSIVSDVNVSVNVSHAYMSDIQLELVNPQGKTVRLLENTCGDRSGSLDLIFDDFGADLSCDLDKLQTVLPIERLGLFNESKPTGIWSLRVRDEQPQDIGTINSASLTICTKKFTLMENTEGDLKSILVYPNPNKGEFNVIFTSDTTTEITIQIHDILGRKIFDKEFMSSPIFNETISLGTAQAGIYFMTVIDGYKKTITKIMIQ